MQIYPSELESIFNSKEFRGGTDSVIVNHRRINFRFDLQKYEQFRGKLNLNEYRFCSIGTTIFNELNGSLVPKDFWDNASDFESSGTGFALLLEDKPVAFAFSSFMHDNFLEL